MVARNYVRFCTKQINVCGHSKPLSSVNWMEATTVPKKESYTKIHGTRQGMPTTHIDMTDNNKGKILA